MINEKFKYSDITEKVIGCAMKVHSTLGSGYQEYIYQRALSIEFGKAQLNYRTEYDMPIHYDGVKIGTRILDFLVDNKIAVELKAVSQLENVHLAQALNYLEAHNLEIGLLLNFGSKSLQFKRIINNKNK
jgi:GxxExxY protein